MFVINNMITRNKAVNPSDISPWVPLPEPAPNTTKVLFDNEPTFTLRLPRVTRRPHPPLPPNQRLSLQLSRKSLELHRSVDNTAAPPALTIYRPTHYALNTRRHHNEHFQRYAQQYHPLEETVRMKPQMSTISLEEPESRSRLPEQLSARRYSQSKEFAKKRSIMHTINYINNHPPLQKMYLEQRSP